MMNFMGGIVLKITGIFLCLISAVLAFLFLDWMGITLSFLSFFSGFLLIYYTHEKHNGKARQNL